MFQTEPNLWLQAHGGPSLTWLMWMISEVGREHVYMLVLVFLTFGVDLRRGWLVGQVLLWTAGLTDYAKHFLALPRPLHVDSRVLYPPSGTPSQEVFTARGATSFLGGLPRDVIDYYRAQSDVAWGLPSGHTSVFTGVSGGLAVVGRRRRWWLATAIAALVMGLSRMYLGRHFLADVLVGGLLGTAAVAVLHLALRRHGGRPSLLEASAAEVARRITQRPFMLFAFVAPLLLLPLAVSQGKIYAAQLGAWNLGFWLLTRRGRSYAGGSPGQRLARVLLALATGYASALGIKAGLDALGLDDVAWADMLGGFLTILLLVVLTARIAERLGLYEGRAG